MNLFTPPLYFIKKVKNVLEAVYRERKEKEKLHC